MNTISDISMGSVMQIALQAGALGLLFVIAWKLPSIVDELKKWREKSEEEHRSERKVWLDAIEKARQDFKEENKFERQQCQAQFERMLVADEKHQQTTIEAIANNRAAITALSTAIQRRDHMAQQAADRVIDKEKESDTKSPPTPPNRG